MIYRDFKGTKLSMLGFGTMRLPVLENGQIIERGDHAQLLEEKGRYYQLYTGQAKLS